MQNDDLASDAVSEKSKKNAPIFILMVLPNFLSGWRSRSLGANYFYPDAGIQHHWFFFFASKMQIFPRRALWSCACFWHLRGESWNKRIYIYIIINFIYRTKNSVTCSESCVQILTWALSKLVKRPSSYPEPCQCSHIAKFTKIQSFISIRIRQ